MASSIRFAATIRDSLTLNRPRDADQSLHMANDRGHFIEPVVLVAPCAACAWNGNHLLFSARRRVRGWQDRLHTRRRMAALERSESLDVPCDRKNNPGRAARGLCGRGN